MTVVVTGAGSGIGLATVNALLARGDRVSAWDIEAGGLRELTSPNLAFHQIDVRDKAAMLQAVAAEAGAGHAVTGLVSCAAIFHRAPYLELEETAWDATFAVNLKGTLFAIQSVLAPMKRSGGGSIVLFSSSIARSGSPTGADYAATKGAILGLMRSLALEVAEDNIRVNAISPGITDTPQPRGHAGGAQAMFAKANTIPLGRIGHADDMADAALFLLDADSSYITGQDLRINGGGQMF